MGSCQATVKKTSNCCGYTRQNHIQMLIDGDYPERSAMNKNRRWNQKAKSPPSTPQKPQTDFIFDDEKVIQSQALQSINVIDDQMFDTFDEHTKHIIFGYIRNAQSILNETQNKTNAIIEPQCIELDTIQIPNNIHYSILLHYYSMENTFDGDALVLWQLRPDVAEFMSTTLQSTRVRMWDKFDKHSKQMLSTQKYLPKFIYTICVLYLKTQERKSTPPKYTKVKHCTKYMASLMMEALPIDQQIYLDKQHFVDHIHEYLALICG
eukprot:310179_1